MKRIIIAPDSFKGTLSSSVICRTVSERVREHFPSCEIIELPVSDGGEGTVESFISALGGEKEYLTVKNPFFEDTEAFLGILSDGTAVIEMSSAAGLPLVEDRPDPMRASTFGVGELILGAVRRGARRIILGLGGSATCDFGCGAAAALGVRFIGEDTQSFIPTGGSLSKVCDIDTSGISQELRGVRITLMCDVKNPPYGPNGAAYVYGPQKGASAEQVEILDRGIRDICSVIEKKLGKDLSELVGGGAAGAMACGMVAFFDAEIRSGIDALLDASNFDGMLDGADLVFTGEGRIDSQSLEGKAVIGVARRARAKGVPTVCIVGGVSGDISPVYGEGVSAVFAINRRAEDFSVSRHKSLENLSDTADDIMRLIKACKDR